MIRDKGWEGEVIFPFSKILLYKFSILGGLGPLAPYSDASDHVWTSLEHLDAFGHVLTHLDVFGRIWTGFGQVWTGFGRVWKVSGGVWRSLEEFEEVFK